LVARTDRIAGRTIYDGTVGDDHERHTRKSPTTGTLWLALPGAVGWLGYLTLLGRTELSLTTELNAILVVSLLAGTFAVLALIRHRSRRPMPHLAATLFVVTANISWFALLVWTYVRFMNSLTPG